MAQPHAPLPPLKGGQLILGTIAVSLAVFMNVLDTSIANVAIPTISGDLGVSSDQGTWVITSFAVANAISVPLTGWLTDRIGQVRLFLASIMLFVISSWMCGLAPTLPFLLASRVLQGAVAGPMIPLSQALLLSSYPRAKAPMALALWSMTTLIAPVAGPILGGWISDNYSWPWIFYVNIPVGIAAAAVTWMIYRSRESAVRRAPIDGVGLALLVIWVGSLQIMLDKGKDLDWFASTTIVVLALTALIAFAFFVVWELTAEHPVVDLSLFRMRNFSGGTIALSVGYGLYFGNLVLLPLWLQTQIGYTATDAGLVMAPVGFFAILLSPLTGKYLSRTDPRYIATAAFLTFALCFWMRSRYTTGVDEWSLMAPTFVQGIAMAGFFIPLVSITLSGLPGHRIPAASGLSNFVRIMCGGIGTSIFQTAWDHRNNFHHAQLVEQATPYNPTFNQAVTQMGQLGLTRDQAHGLINNMATQQAAQLGVNDLFYISAAIFVLLIALIWITKPERAGGGNSSAAASAAH
ncbi:drug resistance MFS transporter, drug:H+ antiporter-2 family protein [Burkholderia thailandensis MSMB121]|uniref:DHA2 family efflux MFS transporter permease subunit n=1 Tax=Burkholderia humptydooensis TaxID=430531 RepID=A0A7U4SSI8_9BURK|nr:MULTISPECIES: DHA2 family efflux MFS transporter permease subunit [Burkholderia]AGK49197.1 drug resistance MFS transporter, drug:H+ antiporter-2 family protein [Burkholderia thailandensis MSMB121]ATF37300.1 MFS transporter [Burkholderia thailandensis]AJY41362.1 drug resistance MFS transporter, drug:H+ antiporter-2 family protein [Burkholderia sp. 2002721687]ALX42841.1 multidrug resistance protein B [Burkholderia humptydooensis]KST74668.1 multidrug resistance protein B [Burkholderia humptydo